MNWRGLTGSFLPGVQMGCVVVSPADTNTLYAGTGEVDYAETYYWGGYGVFKSTDGGAHWTPANNGMSKEVVTDMLINSNDPLKLIACTGKGIYVSTDGAATWTRVVTSPAYMHQLVQRGTSDTIFAISDKLFYTSTNWGATWRSRDLDLATSSKYLNGRIAVAPTDDNIVYASYIIDTTWGDECRSEVFQSTNGGVTFTKVYDQYALPALSSYNGSVSSGGFGFANYCLVVSPTDPNTLFTGAHLIFMSSDGGHSFTQVLANWYCCMHTDIHDLAFDPSDNNTLFAATDGGIFVSNDLGVDWQPSSNGLDCTQYFSTGQSNSDSTFVIGGTQDNGIMYLNDDGNVHTYCGGDFSGFILCDYFNPHNSYTSAGGGLVFDPYNRSNSASLNLPGAISGVTEPLMVFSPLNPGTAWCYLNNVWMSTNLDQYTMDANGGSSSISWTQITNLNGQNVLALAASPVNDNLIYFITDSNLLYTCKLNNGAVQSITSQRLPSDASITASIAISTLNPNVIYITCDDKIYRSANAGANWTGITGNLPPINFQSLFIDPYSTIEAVYLITDLGVYYTGFTMPGWINLDAGFPDTLQNTSANFYQVIAGAGLYKGSNSSSSHISMGTWGAGFQEVYLYNQKCAALNNNWQLMDFGSPSATNSACLDSTFSRSGGPAAITITANGSTIGGAADQFSMVGSELMNDGSITCSLISVTQGDTVAPCETGLMMRAPGNSPAAPFVMAGVNGNGRVFMRSRLSTGATAATTYISTPAVPYPGSLRLIRQGDTISVSGSFDTTGVWTAYGQVIIPLGDTIAAGIAASAGSAGAINQSAFSVPAFTGFAQLNTGIKPVPDKAVKLYPDPAHDFITLDISFNIPVNYIVADMLGRSVMTGYCPANSIGHRIDVSALSAGNYIVNFSDKQHSNIGRARFIKD